VIPKTLLLAGVAPGSRQVGEIILRDLVTHAGPSRFLAVAVAGRRYVEPASSDVEGLNVAVLRAEGLQAKRFSAAKWGAVGSALHQRLRAPSVRTGLQKQIVGLARQAGVQQVFAVLNNAMVFSLAHRVARSLRLPLVSLVWDPPDYQLRVSKFDRWSRSALLGEFRQSLAASSRVAVVSETMQSDYAALTQAPIRLLRHGVEVGSDPKGRDENVPASDEWLLGFAGSMYSSCAWKALCKALDSVGWKVAGKRVRIRMLCANAVLSSRSEASIEYLGFRQQDQVQTLLAECDACYLPQPFVEHLSDLCRYAFPTKLANYLALGRPILAHAPPYSALAPFFRLHNVGVHVDSLDPSCILRGLERLFGDARERAEFGQRARQLAKTNFSSESFQRSVDWLLDEQAAA